LNQIAGTAVAFSEARRPVFRKYAAQVVKNAKALAGELSRLGWRVVSGGTDTHLILFEVASRGTGGKAASVRLETNGIITNKNTIPFDQNPPTDPSGIRLGTPVLTTRGMKEKEMKQVARLIHAVLVENKNVKREVLALCKKFPIR
jgi:glycine hydroxymethyltransferase